MVPSLFQISLIVDIKPEFDITNVNNNQNNYFVNGPNLTYKINGSENRGEDGLISFIRYPNISIQELLLLSNLVGINPADIAPYVDKPFIVLLSFINHGIKFNPSLNTSQNKINYNNKSQDLTNFSTKVGFPTAIGGFDPDLSDKSYFNVDLDYKFFNWKQGTETQQEECYDILYNSANNIISTVEDLYTKMSNAPSSLAKNLISGFYLSAETLPSPPFPPDLSNVPKGKKLTEFLASKEIFINEYVLQAANNNYHICSNNANFVDNLTNKLNMFTNVSIADQSVWAESFGGAFPNSTAIASAAMAERAVNNL